MPPRYQTDTFLLQEHFVQESCFSFFGYAGKDKEEVKEHWQRQRSNFSHSPQHHLQLCIWQWEGAEFRCLQHCGHRYCMLCQSLLHWVVFQFPLISVKNSSYIYKYILALLLGRYMKETQRAFSHIVDVKPENEFPKSGIEFVWNHNEHNTTTTRRKHKSIEKTEYCTGYKAHIPWWFCKKKLWNSNLRKRKNKVCTVQRWNATQHHNSSAGSIVEGWEQYKEVTNQMLQPSSVI